MGNKRGNETSQLSKEEYEALEDNEEESGNPGSGFVKASSAVLQGRRIVRSASKWKAKTGESVSSGGSAGEANPFSKINLAPTTTAVSAPSGSSKPRFAMPTFPTNASMQATASTSSIATQGQEAEIFRGFKNYIRQSNVRQNWNLALTRFLTTMDLQASKENKENEAKKSSAVTLSATPTPIPFNFGSTAPALAPAGTPIFSFGNSTTAPSSVPAFSFGHSTAPAPAGSSVFSFNTASTPAPATAVPFSFAPAPTSAGATPGTNVKFSLSPVPAPDATKGEENDNDEGGPQEEEGDGQVVLGAGTADEDWEQVANFNVKAHHYRDNNKPSKFATGRMKLQQHKKDSSNKRMVMRDASGKVLLNMKIAKGMMFQKLLHDRKGRQPIGSVVFKGLMDEKRGPENFLLICKVDDLDNLQEQLTKMAS